MKVVFLESYKVKAADGAEYEAGVVYDLPESTVEHFIRRGRAKLANMVTTPDVLQSEVVEAIEEPDDCQEKLSATIEPEVGDRGGDPMERLTKAQRAYRKKELQPSE